MACDRGANLTELFSNSPTRSMCQDLTPSGSASGAPVVEVPAARGLSRDDRAHDHNRRCGADPGRDQQCPLAALDGDLAPLPQGDDLAFDVLAGLGYLPGDLIWRSAQSFVSLRVLTVRSGMAM